jgi:hypothetical protein
MWRTVHADHRDALWCETPGTRGFSNHRGAGASAGENQIQDLIRRHGLIFVKPLFRGGVGKKGKAGLIGKAGDLRAALAEKERLYFDDHLNRGRNMDTRTPASDCAYVL